MEDGRNIFNFSFPKEEEKIFSEQFYEDK